MTDRGVRLQKYLARAGVASRRACEKLILDGRVRVDGELISELGVRVQPTSVVHVDGRQVEPAASRWLALHKPPATICARRDPQGRPTVYDLLSETDRALFHVGRLDFMSEGLILFTNDGDLAHELIHPATGLARRYEVTLSAPVPPGLVDRLTEGVELEDGPARAESARLAPAAEPREARLSLVLREGRNREIRRMMEAVGATIHKLKRVSFGPITLANLESGNWRPLSEREVDTLRTAAGGGRERAREARHTSEEI